MIGTMTLVVRRRKARFRHQFVGNGWGDRGYAWMSYEVFSARVPEHLFLEWSRHTWSHRRRTRQQTCRCRRAAA